MKELLGRKGERERRILLLLFVDSTAESGASTFSLHSLPLTLASTSTAKVAQSKGNPLQTPKKL